MKTIQTIDEMIERAKNGESILQFAWHDRSTFLVYIGKDFFLESYYAQTLMNVECISEETARFALTTRYL